MKINTVKEDLLYSACQQCYDEDRSVEYQIQFMMDFAHVSHEVVIDYLWRHRKKGAR